MSSFKKLKELPTSLAILIALKRLDIQRCHSLESLPERVLEGLTSLKELFVQDCAILKSLSKGPQHLTALTRLVVALCLEMMALPFGIQNLHSSITGYLELPSPSISSSWHYGNEQSAGVANCLLSRTGKALREGDRGGLEQNCSHSKFVYELVYL
ncbi:probable disease resistance protein RPP1 [Lycium ferocissimum]|uniref:probable disease resistance protein RPP1 n=1 Tax=Lycium ferocissimum TaxID=112874 RepID=UPI002814FFC4|nr:probable disease resistance protein RPP1 [Lycium ferocissimum]